MPDDVEICILDIYPKNTEYSVVSLTARNVGVTLDDHLAFAANSAGRIHLFLNQEGAQVLGEALVRLDYCHLLLADVPACAPTSAAPLECSSQACLQLPQVLPHYTTPPHQH